MTGDVQDIGTGEKVTTVKQLHSYYHWKCLIMLGQDSQDQAKNEQRNIHVHGGLTFVGVIDGPENHNSAVKAICDDAQVVLEHEFDIESDTPMSIIVESINFTGSKTVEVEVQDYDKK